MQVVVPHAGWRSDYELGTFDDGTLRRCVEVSTGEPVDQTPVEGVPEPGQEPSPEAHTSEHCFAFDWPAQYLWMTHLSRRKAPTGPPVWGGSLIQNKRDLTGQLYMRNRYGLKIECANAAACAVWNRLVQLAVEGMRSENRVIAYYARELNNVLNAAYYSDKTIRINVINKSRLWGRLTGGGHHRKGQITLDPEYYSDRWGSSSEIGVIHEIGHAVA